MRCPRPLQPDQPNLLADHGGARPLGSRRRYERLLRLPEQRPSRPCVERRVRWTGAPSMVMASWAWNEYGVSAGTYTMSRAFNCRGPILPVPRATKSTASPGCWSGMVSPSASSWIRCIARKRDPVPGRRSRRRCRLFFRRYRGLVRRGGRRHQARGYRGEDVMSADPTGAVPAGFLWVGDAGRFSPGGSATATVAPIVASSFVGRSVPRLEDDRLLRGRGRFVDDVDLAGQLCMQSCDRRSPMLAFSVSRPPRRGPLRGSSPFSPRRISPTSRRSLCGSPSRSRARAVSPARSGPREAAVRGGTGGGRRSRQRLRRRGRCRPGFLALRTIAARAQRSLGSPERAVSPTGGSSQRGCSDEPWLRRRRCRVLRCRLRRLRRVPPGTTRDFRWKLAALSSTTTQAPGRCRCGARPWSRITTGGCSRECWGSHSGASTCARTESGGSFGVRGDFFPEDFLTATSPVLGRP